MWLRVFKNWLFYVLFIIFLFLFNYVLNWQVFSFGNLSFWSMSQNIRIWTEFVRQKNLDNTIIWLVFANIKLGEWDYNFHSYLWQAVELTKTQQLLVENDTIELLDSTNNKKAILESHLSEMQLATNKSQEILSTIFDMAAEKKSEAITCENSKNQADTSFFQWLTTNEKDTLIDWLTDSLNNWQCYSENRIYSNAYYAVYDKLNFYNKVLEQKISLIENNEEEILNNYEMFRDNTLEKLVALRDEINSYKSTTQVE